MSQSKNGPVKLTRAAIDRLEPRAKRYSVTIEGFSGLELRVSPNNVKTFSVIYRTQEGKRERYTIGKYGQITPELVAKKARQLTGQVADGRNPQADKREARKTAEVPTLGEFITSQYSDWVETHQKTGNLTIKRLRGAFNEFLSKRLDELTSWDIERWRSTRIRAGISKSTLNRDLAAIRGAIRNAVNWGVISNNPLATVKAHRVGKFGRTRYLSVEEENRLRTALDIRESRIRERRHRHNEWRKARRLPTEDPLTREFADHLKPMVLLSLLTGLRRGELFSLKWVDVDLCTNNLRVLNSTTKNNQTRDIPLNQEACQVLTAWRSQQDKQATLVFPSRNGGRFNNVKRSWAGVLKEACVENFTWHDVRHTFASRLVASGTDLNMVRELLGHSDLSMTLRYAHLAPEQKAAAVARLSNT